MYGNKDKLQPFWGYQLTALRLSWQCYNLMNACFKIPGWVQCGWKKNADCLNLLIRIHFHGIPENYLKREGIELVVKAPTLDPEFLNWVKISLEVEGIAQA